MRFDIFASAKLNISRNKASELIKNGKILLNDKVLNKPSFELRGDEVLKLTDEIYLSRAALKLKGFLEYLNSVKISPKSIIADKTALDIGSSTGGFTQILLANGAKKVVCVDVGSDQLAQSLRDDGRVKIYENTDIRAFKSEAKFKLITCDVSFISLIEILPFISANADKNAFIITLFKPQFEVGLNAKRNKKGVVKDDKAIIKARAKFELVAANLGLMLIATSQSEIKGKEGNIEFFYAFNKR